jgi:hypothetical protein
VNEFAVETFAVFALGRGMADLLALETGRVGLLLEECTASKNKAGKQNPRFQKRANCQNCRKLVLNGDRSGRDGSKNHKTGKAPSLTIYFMARAKASCLLSLDSPPPVHLPAKSYCSYIKGGDWQQFLRWPVATLHIYRPYGSTAR